MSKCLIIAEAGINHEGDYTKAMKMAEFAKHGGADIVKFQTCNTAKLLRANHKDFDTLAGLELSRERWKELARFCEAIEIEFLTTPGELDSLKFAVEELGVKRIKIGSDDLTNRPLLDEADQTGLPLIISTGMATPSEIRDAIYGLNKISLLHCVSLYPCRPDQANLRSIEYLRNTYGCRVGYSDHTACSDVVMAAVAAGAEIIEFHFKLNATKPIDDPVSFDVTELHRLVYDIRELELILGSYGKKPNTQELAQAPQLRKGADGYRGQAA